MAASSLLPVLLLLLAPRDQLAGSSRSEGADGLDSLFRRHWLLHVRDALLRGTGLTAGPDRNPVKHQLLYCQAGIGFHLQILPDGSVGGVHRPSEHCWMTVFAMRRGVVGIKGVMSGLYLCMDEDGLAFGEEEFFDGCLFQENMLENHYTTYSSLSYPGSYLALSHKGRLRKGSTVGPYHISTHFLPRHTL